MVRVEWRVEVDEIDGLGFDMISKLSPKKSLRVLSRTPESLESASRRTTYPGWLTGQRIAVLVRRVGCHRRDVKGEASEVHA